MTATPPAPDERPIPLDDPTFWTDETRVQIPLSQVAPFREEVAARMKWLCLSGAGFLWIVVDSTPHLLTLREYKPENNDVDAILGRIQGNIEMETPK